MRATKLKYSAEKSNADVKTPKRVRALSLTVAAILASIALIVPTTTLAPDVDASEDSRAASFSVGDIEAFSVVISENCIAETTVPATEPETTAPVVKKAKAKKTVKKSKAVAKAEPEKAEKTEVEKFAEIKAEKTEKAEEPKATEPVYVQNAGYLIGISNPDPNYSPSQVALTSYDRAKLERLVMGEAGSMGYNGCALVAQSIRDAMNRSNTSSIDRIISEYKYYAPTNMEPNQTVKDAVSFIFDQNGSAVQHRILCFYTGVSGWHETQNFIVGCGNVRFFDLK